MDYRKTTAPTVELNVATLYVALELSLKTWLVALRSSGSDKVSLKPLPAGDQGALFALIDQMQAELYATGYREVRVVSCYEAGRDGFWLHRRLLEHGVESLVVDAASVAVPQHARRRKTDRLDVRVLLRELIALTADLGAPTLRMFAGWPGTRVASMAVWPFSDLRLVIRPGLRLARV
jgi:transposase